MIKMQGSHMAFELVTGKENEKKTLCQPYSPNASEYCYFIALPSALSNESH